MLYIIYLRSFLLFCFFITLLFTGGEVSASYSGNKYKLLTDTTLYFKEDGQLKPAAYLDKNIEVTIHDDLGSWLEVKIGGDYGYIWKSNAEKATGASVVPNTGYLGKILIHNKVNFYVKSYDSLIKIGSIEEGAEVLYTKKHGNWFEVEFGSAKGYIYDSAATLKFSKYDKKYQVIRNTPVYVKEGSSLKRAGVLNTGQVLFREKEHGDWHQIDFGGQNAFVWQDNSIPVVNGGGENGKTAIKNIGHFITQKNSVVYVKENNKLVASATLDSGITYLTEGLYGNWFKIYFSGKEAFVHKDNVEKVFTSNDKFYETKQEVPLYDNSTGSLKNAGSLFKGFVFKREGSKGSWHEISIGSKSYYIWMKSTSYANNFTSSLDSMRSIAEIETIKDTNLYDKSTGNMVPVSLLRKGTRINIIKDYGNWYSINLSGREAFIYGQNVKITKRFNENIVNPKQTYTYEQLVNDIKKLELAHPGLIKSYVIGNSVDGRKIYAIKLGNGSKEIMFNGSHHAREHMTTNVLMEMIDTYSAAYWRNSIIDGFPVRSTLDKVSMWFVPMVNPDGVTLVQKGHKSAKNSSYVLKLNDYNQDFSEWKANIRGVDLNRQYPADWENIKFNRGKPGPSNFKGNKPLSEPEAKALFNFTINHNFKIATAYHSSGEILYWYFHQKGSNYTRDLSIAMKIKTYTDYSLVQPTLNPSGGGFTDWFIQYSGNPGFTPEISTYTNSKPVPLKNFDRIWKQNKSIGLLLAQEAMKF